MIVRQRGERRFFGYAARGVPFGPDDGTLAPCAALASLPFAPQMRVGGAACAVRALSAPDARRRGCPGGFNPTLPGNGPQGWVSEGFYGLDQGLARPHDRKLSLGLIWQLLRRCPYIGTRAAPRGIYAAVGWHDVLFGVAGSSYAVATKRAAMLHAPTTVCAARECAPAGLAQPAPCRHLRSCHSGRGTRGLLAARGAATLGTKVALIERDLLGGNCLNVGCVPSKALIRTSRLYARMREARELGVARPIGMRMRGRAMQRIRRLQARLSRADSAIALRERGVDLYFGAGALSGPRSCQSMAGVAADVSKRPSLRPARGPHSPQIPGS